MADGLERALLYLLFLFVAGIVAAVFVRQARPMAIVMIAILIYIPNIDLYS